MTSQRGSARCSRRASSRRCCFLSRWMATPVAPSSGRIGLGPPLATGAAVACPDRKVVGLQADGSAMYTVQALWTQAREGLDVTTVLFSNRAYQILKGELSN